MVPSSAAKKTVLFLALLSAFSLAATVSMLIPAVLEDSGGGGGPNGQMIRFTLEARNGSGIVYVATSPLIGTDTQTSERTAVAVGMSEAGANPGAFDVLLAIQANEAKRVDGPSAGAAMTLLTISAVTGRQIRSDFAITGTINPDGSIGLVGGVPSKVEAAASRGMKVVAVPSGSSVFDKILLASARKKLNITIAEVATISEAEAVAFSPEGSVPEVTPPAPGPQVSPLPAYSYSCTSCRADLFAKNSEGVLESMDAAIQSANGTGGESYSAVLPYLEKTAADSREMFSKGYYYTGANAAFLNLIDAKVLANSTITKAELDRFISGAGQCADRLERPATTRENIEFVAGGDLRAIWAKRKLAEVRSREENESGTQEGLLGLYRDALYSEGWCGIAAGLYAGALEIGGEPANESVLRGFAETRINDAGDALGSGLVSGSDAEWHYGGAEAAFESGQYFAAIIGADYILAFASADNMSSESEAAKADWANSVSSRQGSTLWSSLFYAHAKFYLVTENNAPSGNVLTIGALAEKFEADGLQAKSYLANPDGAPPANTTPTPEGAQGIISQVFGDAKTAAVYLFAGLLVASQLVNIILFMSMRAKLKRRDAAYREAIGALQQKPEKPPARKRRE
ncbi:Archaeal Lon protease [uncultured archaeon]|nr:Archaeal Lon protease [uncultured archaeon]